MQKSSVEPEIFPTFQHKVERVPHFARVSEVRHMDGFFRSCYYNVNSSVICIIACREELTEIKELYILERGIQ